MTEASDNTLSMESISPDGMNEKGPHLFLLLECDRPGAGSSRHALRELDEIVIGRGAERGVVRTLDERRLELRIPDARLSSRHARLQRQGRGFQLEDLGSKNGTVVNGRKLQSVALSDGDVIELGHTFFLFRESCTESGRLDITEAVADVVEEGTTSLHPDLARRFDDLRRIAASPLSVIVLGESGTGKELIARAVHRLSGRTGQFVAVNCGAISTHLVESELFGYRKGAFSGAQEDRPGLVRSAHGGTLFLDEIGDLAAPAQAALLRVLQEREVLPVGGTRPIPVDVRIIAATHRDIESLATSERFRADLLARLRGFAFRLTPLRQRREDFGLILGALSRRVAGHPFTFSPEAVRILLRHEWPLNVRELEQCITAAAALAQGRIQAEHLPDSVRAPRAAAPAGPARPGPAPIVNRELTPEEKERRDELLALLEKHQGNISAVSRELGKDRVQIRRWMRLYGIDAGRDE